MPEFPNRIFTWYDLGGNIRQEHLDNPERLAWEKYREEANKWLVLAFEQFDSNFRNDVSSLRDTSHKIHVRQDSMGRNILAMRFRSLRFESMSVAYSNDSREAFMYEVRENGAMYIGQSLSRRIQQYHDNFIQFDYIDGELIQSGWYVRGRHVQLVFSLTPTPFKTPPPTLRGDWILESLVNDQGVKLFRGDAGFPFTSTILFRYTGVLDDRWNAASQPTRGNWQPGNNSGTEIINGVEFTVADITIGNQTWTVRFTWDTLVIGRGTYTRRSFF